MRKLVSLLALALSTAASAQSVAITVPGNVSSVAVGDTIKGITATAYDSRHRRVPSARFKWTADPTVFRMYATGKAVNLIGLKSTAGVQYPLKVQWLRRTDNLRPENTVYFMVNTKAPIVASVDDSSCYMKPSVGDSLRAAGVLNATGSWIVYPPPSGVCHSNPADGAVEWSKDTALFTRLGIRLAQPGQDSTKLPPTLQLAAMRRTIARRDSLDRIIPQSQLAACRREVGKYKVKFDLPNTSQLLLNKDGTPKVMSPGAEEDILLHANLSLCQSQLARLKAKKK